MLIYVIMASEHDSRYKSLFSKPYFLEKLLQSFVNEPFVNKLDFNSLKRLDKSFISANFRKKEADLLFSVNYSDRPVYIYLLLELQSTVDKMMAVRFLRYITEVYESYHRKGKNLKLPAVFPLLLYNGDAKWTAETSVQDMIEHTIPVKYIPCFSYYPVLEYEFSRETLCKIKNAVSAVFYVENSDPEELERRIDTLIDIIINENPAVLNDFASWFANFLETSAGRKGSDDLLLKIDGTLEVKTMFATKLKKYGEKLKKEKGLEDAKNLKELGVSIDIICKATGLDKKTVEKL